MKKIKLFDPVTGKNEENAIKKILHNHNWASGAGSGSVYQFEKKFSDFLGSKNCVSVNSGTAALHLGLSLFDIKDKEVILPSLSFVTTAHAIIYNGGIPVFVDIDPKTLCIDPKEIEKAVTKNTRVILPVHLGGMPCDLQEISKISKKFGLSIVEDAAHAAGAKYNGKKIGNHGNCVCFSFHPVKNLAMPSGGAITINSKSGKQFSEILKSKRWAGITGRKGPIYDVSSLGWNYYMNEFSAAIGIEQLKKLNKTNSQRKKIAKRYSKELEIEEKMPFDKNCSFHFYWIQVKNRKNFMKKMSENNIETGIHYNPIHKMSFYNSKIALPITETAGSRIVSLPTHPNLTDNDINRIIKMANKFAR
jgi:dTDP-4-amino-4,6-dideoxygalactose transaminase